jgi:hypothetical protein
MNSSLPGVFTQPTVLLAAKFGIGGLDAAHAGHAAMTAKDSVALVMRDMRTAVTTNRP